MFRYGGNRENFAMKYIKDYLDRVKLSIKRKSNKIKSFIKILLTILNQHGNLIVAIATVTLAFITWSYIEEARQMRLETKRLADISVDQFKIRAYPSFLISPEIKVESDELIQTFKIYARGEIIIHKFSAVAINTYEREKGLLFNISNRTIYKGEKSKKTVLNFEEEILPNTTVTLEDSGPFPDNHSINTLKHLLIFIRFWVPYDSKYSYKTFGYILKNTDSGYIWQIISQDDTRNLISKIKGIDNKDKIVEDFFSDYNYKVGVVSRTDF